MPFSIIGDCRPVYIRCMIGVDQESRSSDRQQAERQKTATGRLTARRAQTRTEPPIEPATPPRWIDNQDSSGGDRPQWGDRWGKQR